ncbi:hypothetical protein [Streptomyces sp. NPDC057623]|uniref:hypothetical protein n=1 Tax=Streptomyces sp. NPDC057623 TaxID=3346187 RepID=UPI003694082A
MGRVRAEAARTGEALATAGVQVKERSEFDWIVQLVKRIGLVVQLVQLVRHVVRLVRLIRLQRLLTEQQGR